MGPPILDRVGPSRGVFCMGQMSRCKSTYHRPDARPGGLRAALRRPAAGAAALAAGLALAGGAGARSATAATTGTLVVEGAGEGHGVGMSQDGALGYAQHGATYAEILAHYFTGTTIGQAPAATVVKVLVGSKVKRVPLERYLRGVIANEMSPTWPAAALEAQAVASRTYALTAHAGGSRFDVYSDSRSQVYRGAAAEWATTNAAVAATAGQILLYEGQPAISYFFASSGGMTESVQNAFPGSAAEPWLVGVVDPYEASTSRWKFDIPFATAARRLRGLFKGSFRGVEVLTRGTSPRVVLARVLGTAAAMRVSGPVLAARLGLPSTWDYFDVLRGAALRQEPDKSGRARTWTPVPEPAPASPGASGGVAPPSAAASGAPDGGTASG